MVKFILSTFLLLSCSLLVYSQADTTLIKNIDPSYQLFKEKNMQYLINTFEGSKEQKVVLVEDFVKNYDIKLSDEQRKLIYLGIINDSDFKTWPQDIKDLGLFLIIKHDNTEGNNPSYYLGRKGVIKTVATLMYQAIPELDYQKSGVSLTYDQQIQLIRERMPLILNK